MPFVIGPDGQKLEHGPLPAQTRILVLSVRDPDDEDQSAGLCGPEVRLFAVPESWSAPQQWKVEDWEVEVSDLSVLKEVALEWHAGAKAWIACNQPAPVCQEVSGRLGQLHIVLRRDLLGATLNWRAFELQPREVVDKAFQAALQALRAAGYKLIAGHPEGGCQIGGLVDPRDPEYDGPTGLDCPLAQSFRVEGCRPGMPPSPEEAAKLLGQLAGLAR